MEEVRLLFADLYILHSLWHNIFSFSRLENRRSEGIVISKYTRSSGPAGPKAKGPLVDSAATAFLAKIEMRAIDDVRPNSRNARTHSKKQIRQIARSVRRFGFLNPILADETGTVLAGHGRLEAARLLGILQVPVVAIAHLSDTDKRAYVIADNKLAENAGWDREMLAIELGELAVILPEIDLDIGITGFATGELDSLLLDHAADERDPADSVEFPKDRPVTSRHGDLWQMRQQSGHRLLCGDARSRSDVARLTNGAVVAMVITDPPYNVPVNGHVGGRGKTQHAEFAFASGEMSAEQYRVFLSETIDHMITACGGGALVYVFIDWRHVEDLLQVCRALGLGLRNICVWNKTTPGQGSFYRSAHEMIVIGQVPGADAINNIELGRHGRNRTMSGPTPASISSRLARMMSWPSIQL